MWVPFVWLYATYELLAEENEDFLKKNRATEQLNIRCL